MTQLRRLLLSVPLVVFGLAAAGCDECVAYNDCPQGQFCNNDHVCVDHVALPGASCRAGGASDFFLTRAQLGGATHFECELPDPNASGVFPEFIDHTGNTVLVSGGTTTLDLFWNRDLISDEALEGKYFYLGIRGTDQMFARPVEELMIAGELPNPLPLELFLSQSTGGQFPVTVGFADAFPDVDLEEVSLVAGPHYDIPFDVIRVQSGDIQISISWDKEVDIDLWVKPPTEPAIGWSNRAVASGGELDLDANAACGRPEQHNENIYWPDNAAPSGEYKVWVDYWSSCMEPDAVSFRVTRVLRRDEYEIYDDLQFIASDVSDQPYSEENPLFTFQF